ncbi:MAG TPA: hypothetical protein VIU85_05120 [Chthoniobacterales bacterium]
MKRTASIWLSILLGAILPSFGQITATATASGEASFEELPELKASEILKPEFLKGPHFTVRESVPTFSGTNQFVIDSDYGVFEADGNEMLMRRVKEVGAIAQLKDVSRTDQFKDSLAAAARGPINGAKNLVTDPANTISNVPKGIMKFMGRAGESLKNVGKKSEGKDPQGNNAERLIGYSNAKRKIAIKLGVDPYSTNTVLQKELDGIAWASFAGGFAFTAATLPISGGVGMALSVTKTSNSLENMLNEKSPSDLKIINRQALSAMGVNQSDSDRLLNNNSFSPTTSTAFVLNLQSLKGVANRAAFVRAAAEKSSSEPDALFCVLTSSLMSKLHEQKQLARIVMLGDFPVSIAQDGTVVLALQWDYAAWTSRAASFTAQIQELAQQSGNKGVLVALSGQASPRLQQELKSRGFTVQDRLSPGPLK